MTQIPQVFLLPVALMFFCTSCLKAEIVKILIQGDTQKIMDLKNGEQDNFVPLMAKVLTDPVTRDADFIFQMGDIVESDTDNSDRPQQYEIAREGWRQIDGKIPYILNLGNNDNAEEYLAAFDDLPSFFSKTSDGRNFAYKFSAGDVEWLVISMRFHEIEEDKSNEIYWAESLIEANPDSKVIFIKHEVNSNSGLVNRLKGYANVVFVLSGHTQSEYKMLTGDYGNKIAWIRTCHHNANLDSYFRMLLIDTVKGTVKSSFYSPQYEQSWHEPTAPYHDCARSAPWTQTGFDFGLEETEAAANGTGTEFISLEIPCCVITGSEFKATAVLKNTGATWDADLPQNNYNLGSENPRDNQDWGTETIRTSLSRNVVSGEHYQFEINCIAPANEGYYNFQRRMVQEGVQWFGEFSENRVVYVASNKVVDGSFEDNNASSWILGSGASISPDVKRSGNSSLMLTDAPTVTRQTIPLKKNTNYNISVWVKSNMSETSGNVFFDTKDIFDGTNEGQFIIAPGEATEWTKFSGRFNSRKFDSLTLRMFGNKLAGTVYFDDVILVPSRLASSDSSVPTANAYKDKEYRFEIDISGFESSSLNYAIHSRPGWLTFDSATGILSGTPEEKDIGVHAVTLNVSSAEKSENFAFAIRVFDTFPYAFWDEEYEVGSETGDDDKDGLQNFLEFALGGNPDENDAVSKLPKLSPNRSRFNLTFRRNQSTVTYTIKKSTDLVNWSDHVLVNDSHGPVGDTCNVSIPASKEKQFFKLEVSQ